MPTDGDVVKGKTASGIGLGLPDGVEIRNLNDGLGEGFTCTFVLN
jgi:hypothetical protein